MLLTKARVAGFLEDFLLRAEGEVYELGPQYVLMAKVNGDVIHAQVTDSNTTRTYRETVRYKGSMVFDTLDADSWQGVHKRKDIE